MPSSGQLELDCSSKFISRCSSVSAAHCSLLSVMMKTLGDKGRQRKIQNQCGNWDLSSVAHPFHSWCLALKAFMSWFSLVLLIPHYTITLFACLAWSSKQQTEGWVNVLIKQAGVMYIYIHILVTHSFFLFAWSKELIHCCCKLSAHKDVTTAHYLCRYSYRTLWKYVTSFIEYV